MAETITLEMTEEEAAHLLRVMDEYLDKIGKIPEAMLKDRAEIERYREETRAIIERLSPKVTSQNGSYPERNGNRVEVSLLDRARANGWVDYGLFADDPRALELFDEIERERDKHLVGGDEIPS